MEAGKHKVEVPALCFPLFCPPEDILPCSQKAERVRKTEERNQALHCLTGTDLILRALSSGPHPYLRVLLKVSPPNALALGLRAPTNEIWRGHNSVNHTASEECDPLFLTPSFLGLSHPSAILLASFSFVLEFPFIL